MIRNAELKGSGNIRSCIVTKVARGICRTASLDRMDDHKLHVFGDFCAFSDTDLTRAATVDCATSEAQGLGGAHCHDVLLSQRESVIRETLAWVIRTIGFEW